MNQSVCAAPTKLATNERKMMGVRALAGAEPVSTLAARHGVSRPLVYRQMHKASAALDELFSPTQTDAADQVLFSLPVTRRWLEQATDRQTQCNSTERLPPEAQMREPAVSRLQVRCHQSFAHGGFHHQVRGTRRARLWMERHWVRVVEFRRLP
jgi:hypothetical protein